MIRDAIKIFAAESWKVLFSGGSTPSDKAGGASDKGGRSSRPWDNGEGGKEVSKNFFSVWSKNKGGPGPRAPSPGTAFF